MLKNNDYKDIYAYLMRGSRLVYSYNRSNYNNAVKKVLNFVFNLGERPIEIQKKQMWKSEDITLSYDDFLTKH